MSYEVYINVKHHPRHLDEFAHTLSDCGRFVEPKDSTPSDVERLRTVVAALRRMADRYDPYFRCSHCGELRADHFGYPARAVRCFNRYGPITQSKWWE